MNVSLFGQLNPVPIRYSGTWGWTSPLGNEYALLGGFQGTHVISIDDSLNVYQVDFVDGQDSNWREITVVEDHAYVVTEGSGSLQGMQVIDLRPLPDSVHLVLTYTATFTRGHVIMRDVSTDSSLVYVSGTSTTGGVHILNVSDPGNPLQVGLYNPPYYIHDAHIRGEMLFASALGEGLDIVDISDKSSPRIVSRIDYPGQFTHSVWTTPDLSHVVIADEVDGRPARIWNIEDIENPFEVSQYSANLASLVHNPYVLGDLVFFSHNTEGLRVVDIADPAIPVEVGFYDTYPGPSGGSNGLWSAFPYLPSGKILGGNRGDGLYVWRFNGTRAGRFYGVVLDSIGMPLPGAEVSIPEAGESRITDENGLFAVGLLPAPPEGLTIITRATGHEPDTLSGVPLNGGDSTWLEIRLEPIIVLSAQEWDGPAATILYQNHPNPFNPATSIVYAVGSRETVLLEVFDPLGRRVVTLVNGTQAPGRYAAEWNATGFSSGVYFCRLTTDSFVQTMKLVLLR